MSSDNPDLVQFQKIYEAPESREGGKLTQQALDEIAKINYSSFSMTDIQVVQNAADLPDELAVKILKGWMRRQDELLLNLRGDLIYEPQIPKKRLDEFINMMECPSDDCRNNLIVHNILHEIATGGGLRSETAVPLIDPNHFDNGIIRFDQSKMGNDSRSGVEHLLDFNNETFYRNKTTQEAFFIIGLPPFMKVRLTKYLLRAPPKIPQYSLQGGPKSWDLFGSNDWNEIQNGTPVKIHSANSDMNLRAAGAEYEYECNSDQYFRYFKFALTGSNHQNTNEIILSRFDITGNIITCRE